MRVLTWNTNSLRPRLPRLLALLERERPDIVCLQETKALDDELPFAELRRAGYVANSHGQRPYNGVAILSRTEPDEITRSFPGDPTPGDARVITARFGDLTVVNVYVVNGRRVGEPAFQLKLEWLAALYDWITHSFVPEDKLVLAGDLNIAPEDRDVYDPAQWRGAILSTELERSQLERFLEWGFVDLFRLHTHGAGHYTWWDYRAGAFHRGWGLRIDLILGTPPMARRCVEVRIDRNERRPSAGEGKPSDHAPVVASFLP